MNTFQSWCSAIPLDRDHMVGWFVFVGQVVHHCIATRWSYILEVRQTLHMAKVAHCFCFCGLGTSFIWKTCFHLPLHRVKKSYSCLILYLYFVFVFVLLLLLYFCCLFFVFQNCQGPCALLFSPSYKIDEHVTAVHNIFKLITIARSVCDQQHVLIVAQLDLFWHFCCQHLLWTYFIVTKQ